MVFSKENHCLLTCFGVVQIFRLPGHLPFHPKMPFFRKKTHVFTVLLSPDPQNRVLTHLENSRKELLDFRFTPTKIGHRPPNRFKIGRISWLKTGNTIGVGAALAFFQSSIMRALLAPLGWTDLLNHKTFRPGKSFGFHELPAKTLHPLTAASRENNFPSQSTMLRHEPWRWVTNPKNVSWWLVKYPV